MVAVEANMQVLSRPGTEPFLILFRPAREVIFAILLLDAIFYRKDVEDFANTIAARNRWIIAESRNSERTTNHRSSNIGAWLIVQKQNECAVNSHFTECLCYCTVKRTLTRLLISTFRTPSCAI